MEIFARQGDLVIERLGSSPAGEYDKAIRTVFAGDSSGHPHVLLGAHLVRRDGRRTFVRIESALAVTHGKPDGHGDVELPPGEYVIRLLRERGDGSDRVVED